MPSLKKILLVDDDAPVREALARALAAENYYVLAAADAREGFDKVRETPIDAAVVDLDVPDQHRWQTVRRLSAANPGISVIGMTARTFHSSLAVAAELEAVVQKPFEIGELLRLLEQSSAGRAAN